MLCSDKKPLESTGPSKKKNVNLLPVLDPYIMGYKERERYLDDKYYDNVFDFNGNAAPTILIDGGRGLGFLGMIPMKISRISLHHIL